MPSFDVVSEFDIHEARNAVDQANREVDTRFDFKGTGSKFVIDGELITMTSLHEARQKVILRKGIESLLAKRLVKTIKASKLKVQAAIQGDKLRITGKKRDDLQAAISLLKETDVEMPLQYDNFRD